MKLFNLKIAITTTFLTAALAVSNFGDTQKITEDFGDTQMVTSISLVKSELTKVTRHPEVFTKNGVTEGSMGAYLLKIHTAPTDLKAKHPQTAPNQRAVTEGNKEIGSNILENAKNAKRAAIG